MPRDVFLYREGIDELAETLRGDETIFMGVRPAGFHAGNMLTMVAYPFVLNMQISRRVEPKFHYFISINDWEPESVVYNADNAYDFRVEGTSFQYAEDDDGCCKSMADHWEDTIIRNIRILEQHFPSTSLTFVKNSELRSNPTFLDCLERTLHEENEILKVIGKTVQKYLDADNISLASAICTHCHSGRTKTYLTDRYVEADCSNCDKQSSGRLDELDYWWYHLPMLAPRLAISRADVIIRGGDHYRWNGIEVSWKMLEYFSPSSEMPATLVSPMLLSHDGRKMSKSSKNEIIVEFDKLVRVAEREGGSEVSINDIV